VSNDKYNMIRRHRTMSLDRIHSSTNKSRAGDRLYERAFEMKGKKEMMRAIEEKVCLRFIYTTYEAKEQ
jgi:hypothetical protein